MKIHFCIKQIVLLMALYSSLCTGKAFIFDFGGVLVLTNKMVSLRTLGMLNIVKCSFQLGISPFSLDRYIKTTLFTILTAIEKIHNLGSIHSCHIAYDEQGNELPLLMCAWLQGVMTPSEVRILIENEINLHPEWFACKAEQHIIQNLTSMIFTPELFVRSRTISKAGIAFIKKCKREGHKVYGLSNWDAESFAILKAQHPELFDLFDGIVVSALVHANKPHATIYQMLLDRYQLTPHNCWFIDDQQENIEAAQKLGINGVIHHSNFANLIKDIRLAHSKSAALPEKRKNNGANDNAIKTTNNAIIDGEKISPTDSTIFNCLPANV